jgi:hypothetical protein
MGRRSIIWRNKLEEYVIDLFENQRKTFPEIAEIIQKEKNISISRESIRNFINSEFPHANTSENTVIHA